MPVPHPFGSRLFDSLDKGRGQGRGMGGPAQMDGGAVVDYCPMCGYQSPHERGIPARGKECPKCHIPLMGASSPEDLAPQYPVEEVEVVSSDEMSGSEDTEKGGKGSGHHGHRGRPGRRGGSLPSIGQRATGGLSGEWGAGGAYAGERKTWKAGISAEAQAVLNEADMSVKDVMRLVTPGGMLTKRFFMADDINKNASLWFHLRDYQSLHWDDAGLNATVTGMQGVGAREQNIEGVRNANAYLAKCEELRQRFIGEAEQFKQRGQSSKEQEALQNALALQREAMIYTGVRDDLVHYTTAIAKQEDLQAFPEERARRQSAYLGRDVVMRGGDAEGWKKYFTSVDENIGTDDERLGTYNVRGAALSADARKTGNTRAALSMYIDVMGESVLHYNSRYISGTDYDTLLRQDAVRPRDKEGGGLVRGADESDDAFNQRIDEWVAQNRHSTVYAGSSFMIMNSAVSVTEASARSYYKKARKASNLYEKALWLRLSAAKTALAARFGKQSRSYLDTVRALVPSDTEIQGVPDASQADGVSTAGGRARPPESRELPVGREPRAPVVPPPSRRVQGVLPLGPAPAAATPPTAEVAPPAAEVEPPAPEPPTEPTPAATPAGMTRSQAINAIATNIDSMERSRNPRETQWSRGNVQRVTDAISALEGTDLSPEDRELVDRAKAAIERGPEPEPPPPEATPEPEPPAPPPAPTPAPATPPPPPAPAPASTAAPTPPRRRELPARRPPRERRPVGERRPTGRRVEFGEDVLRAARGLFQRLRFSEDDSRRFEAAAREGTIGSERDVLSWLQNNVRLFRNVDEPTQKRIAGVLAEQLGIKEQ